MHGYAITTVVIIAFIAGSLFGPGLFLLYRAWYGFVFGAAYGSTDEEEENE